MSSKEAALDAVKAATYAHVRHRSANVDVNPDADAVKATLLNTLANAEAANELFSIDLHGCSLNDVEAAQVLDAIPSMAQLCRVDVGGHHMSEDVVYAFLEAVHANDNVVSLALGEGENLPMNCQYSIRHTEAVIRSRLHDETSGQYLLDSLVDEGRRSSIGLNRLTFHCFPVHLFPVDHLQSALEALRNENLRYNIDGLFIDHEADELRLIAPLQIIVESLKANPWLQCGPYESTGSVSESLQGLLNDISELSNDRWKEHCAHIIASSFKWKHYFAKIKGAAPAPSTAPEQTTHESEQPVANESSPEDTERRPAPETTTDEEQPVAVGAGEAPAEEPTQPAGGEGEGESAAEKEEREKAAALKIQSQYRGHAARGQLREHKAARAIQTQYRGHVARSQLNDHKAARTIQSRYRGYVSRGRIQEIRRNNAAARRIQAQYRGHAVRKTLQRRMEEERAQTAPTQVKRSSDTPQQRPNRHQAATRIQSRFRGHSARKRVLDAKTKNMLRDVASEERSRGTDPMYASDEHQQSDATVPRPLVAPDPSETSIRSSSLRSPLVRKMSPAKLKSGEQPITFRNATYAKAFMYLSNGLSKREGQARAVLEKSVGPEAQYLQRVAEYLSALSQYEAETITRISTREIRHRALEVEEEEAERGALLQLHLAYLYGEHFAQRYVELCGQITETEYDSRKSIEKVQVIRRAELSSYMQASQKELLRVISAPAEAARLKRQQLLSDESQESMQHLSSAIVEGVTELKTRSRARHLHLEAQKCATAEAVRAEKRWHEQLITKQRLKGTALRFAKTVCLREGRRNTRINHEELRKQRLSELRESARIQTLASRQAVHELRHPSQAMSMSQPLVQEEPTFSLGSSPSSLFPPAPQRRATRAPSDGFLLSPIQRPSTSAELPRVTTAPHDASRATRPATRSGASPQVKKRPTTESLVIHPEKMDTAQIDDEVVNLFTMHHIHTTQTGEDDGVKLVFKEAAASKLPRVDIHDVLGSIEGLSPRSRVLQWNRLASQALRGGNAAVAGNHLNNAVLDTVHVKGTPEELNELRIITENNLSCVARTVGDYRKALKHLTAAMALEEQASGAPSVSSLLNASTIITLMDDGDNALAYCRRALKELQVKAEDEIWRIQHASQQETVVLSPRLKRNVVSAFHNLAMAQATSSREVKFARGTFAHTLKMSRGFLGLADDLTCAVERSSSKLSAALMSGTMHKSHVKPRASSSMR